MSVYEMARNLAEEALKSKEAKKFLELKYILDGDVEAQNKLNKYSSLKNTLKIRKNSMTKDEFEHLNNELSSLTKNIQEDTLLTDYFNAEKEFNIYINSILDIFNASLFGEFEDEEEKGGGCCNSGCGGCSGC